MNRNEMLATLHETTQWDIVIIGGGATGLGCAVDAANRGFKTLLVERFDFAKGTSSRSTKLVHGGVRYLAQGNIKLVMEALRERAYLLRNAPHVTSVMAFVVPAFTWYSKWFYAIGLKMYDLLAGKLSLGKTVVLNRQETAEKLPGLNLEKCKGGILYYDGQFDDARLAIDLAKTAARQGAVLLNYCSAKGLVKKDNNISGVCITDEMSGEEITVEAKSVINATGVFADAVMQMDEPEKNNLIAPSQGVHLVIDQRFFPGKNALMIPKTDDGRVLFAVPWHNKVILGTTDTPVQQLEVEPKALDEELDFILHHANRYLQKTITKNDVTSVFAGLRPLIKKLGTGSTSLLSRDHTIVVSKSGLITVSGGKWTTYRKMAEDAVDKAIEVSKLPVKECKTRNLRIVDSFDQPLIKTDENLTGKSAFTDEQIKYFIMEEIAVTLEDVLARRTRFLFLDAGKALSMAPKVARQMASILNKDQRWIDAQLTSFTKLAKQYLMPLR